MRRKMDAPLPAAPLPTGIVVQPLSTWTARDVRALMNDVYAQSEGDAPVAFAPWWAALTADAEYDAALGLVALSGDRVVGYGHGWRVPFVKDLVVAPGWRRQGLGGALLGRLLDLYRARQAASVDLKTSVDNTIAQALYRRFGFEIVERIG
jgi:ribosomal protein S18 acetylase RimI-like enzyme